jgi:hypothetical protein
LTRREPPGPTGSELVRTAETAAVDGVTVRAAVSASLVLLKR